MKPVVVSIEFVSYLLAATSFLFLAVLVAFGRTHSRPKRYLLAASLASALWSMAVLAPSLVPFGASLFVASEVLRNLAWIVFLLVVLEVSEAPSVLTRHRRTVLGAGALCAVVVLACHVLAVNGLVPEGWLQRLGKISAVAWVGFAILGLVLLENLFRSADTGARWGLKYLVFGLGIVFAYDLMLYADALLFNALDASLFQARGFVNLLAMPPIAIAASRASSWQVDIHVSRSAVLHTAAILGSGLYLVGMATAGLYVRQFGGDWGRAFQVIFLAAAVLLLLAVFGSSSFRARLRVWISKHFFSYKYDYREEWLRFISTVADEGHGGALRERVIRAVAAIMDCRAGALWVHRPGDRAFIPSASWNISSRLPAEPEDGSLARFLASRLWIVDLEEYRRDRSRYGTLELPEWMVTERRMWLVVPLVYRGKTYGFLVLGQPGLIRALEWEDYDLLKTVGHQAASYLAEEEAVNDLSDARRLQAFNERFAFVVHDIKNSVSQLSLMLQNAEAHGGNPEFQKDMLETVQNTVLRMRTLLEQFRKEGQPAPATPAEAPHRPHDAVVREAIDRWRRQKPDIEVDVEEAGSAACVDAASLASVVDHLMQNALEAAGTAGRIAVRQRCLGGYVRLAISDDGPGMDPAYVRDQLFRPLDSSKQTGYGLGAYQTRQMVRAMGGRLEVESEIGRGTTMIIVLPIGDGERGGFHPRQQSARAGMA